MKSLEGCELSIVIGGHKEMGHHLKTVQNVHRKKLKNTNDLNEKRNMLLVYINQ